MSWQRVAALALLVGGAVAAAKFHNDLIAATLAGAAAGFAVNRESNGVNGASSRTYPPNSPAAPVPPPSARG